MTRCLKPLLEPHLLTFSRREFADSTCRPRLFLVVFFFLRKSPITSVRTINMMIEDTQQMMMMVHVYNIIHRWPVVRKQFCVISITWFMYIYSTQVACCKETVLSQSVSSVSHGSCIYNTQVACCKETVLCHQYHMVHVYIVHRWPVVRKQFCVISITWFMYM